MMIPMCGHRSCTCRASANPSMVPGRFMSVKSNCTSESAASNSSALSLSTASMTRKPASTNMPTPKTRTNASSSTIRIEAGRRAKESTSGNTQRGISFRGLAYLESMEKSRTCYEVPPTLIRCQLARSNVDAADKPEHNHDDQNQTENAAESGPAIPIIAMVTAEAAEQQNHQDDD